MKYRYRFLVFTIPILLVGCSSGRINGSLRINEPIDEVFQEIMDLRNEPTYNPNMLYVALDTKEPIGIGSQFSARVKSGKDTVNMTILYTGFKVNEFINSESVSNNMVIDGGLKFSRLDSVTILEWSWNVKLSGSLKLFGPLVTVMGKKQEIKIWTGLKDRLENKK